MEYQLNYKNKLKRIVNTVIRWFFPIWNKKEIDEFNISYEVTTLRDACKYYYKHIGEISPMETYLNNIEKINFDDDWLVQNQVYLNGINYSHWPNCSALAIARYTNLISESKFKFKLWGFIKHDLHMQNNKVYQEPHPDYLSNEYEDLILPLLNAEYPDIFPLK